MAARDIPFVLINNHNPFVLSVSHFYFFVARALSLFCELEVYRNRSVPCASRLLWDSLYAAGSNENLAALHATVNERTLN